MHRTGHAPLVVRLRDPGAAGCHTAVRHAPRVGHPRGRARLRTRRRGASIGNRAPRRRARPGGPRLFDHGLGSVRDLRGQRLRPVLVQRGAPHAGAGAVLRRPAQHRRGHRRGHSTPRGRPAHDARRAGGRAARGRPRGCWRHDSRGGALHPARPRRGRHRGRRRRARRRPRGRARAARAGRDGRGRSALRGGRRDRPGGLGRRQGLQPGPRARARRWAVVPRH